MIRISRTSTVPKELLADGPVARKRACDAVDAGATRLKFDESVYGHEKVRERLAEDQHNKCCYCESPLDRGTIDHFRPKNSVHQEPEEPQRSRGYYWLAYEWRNLYLACSTCNTSCKRDLFPLEDPLARVCHHADADHMDRERPLLLDPCLDDPTQHIRFERQTPVALTPRGRRTIEVLRLDRPSLETSRGRVLAPIDLMLVVLESARRGLNVPETILDEACGLLARVSRTNEPYAAAIRGALRERLGTNMEFPLSATALRQWARSGAG